MYVGKVPNVEQVKTLSGVRVFHGRGRTLMSGLGDGHTHFSWNGGDLDQLGTLGVEEHTLLTMRSAQCFLDSGYTMCFGAAAAKERLDVVIRDAINAGDIPGPRYLANGKEMAKRGGELVGGITAFADGPEEMREVIRHHVRLGVDNIKLSMSGEEVRQIVTPWKAVCLNHNFRSQSFDPHKTAFSQKKRQQHVQTKLTSTANAYALTREPATPS